MRVYVTAKGPGGKEETHVVAVTDTGRPVSSIVDELVARGAIRQAERPEAGYQLRLAENSAILSGGNTVGDVLKDGDYLTIGKREVCWRREGARDVIPALCLAISLYSWLWLSVYIPESLRTSSVERVVIGFRHISAYPHQSYQH